MAYSENINLVPPEESWFVPVEILEKLIPPSYLTQILSNWEEGCTRGGVESENHFHQEKTIAPLSPSSPLNPDPPTPVPPPDPPDPTPAIMEEDTPRKMSYKETAEESSDKIHGSSESPMNFEKLGTLDPESGKKYIPLTDEDKQRLYLSWRRSVIIKCIGRKLNHQFLRSKITDLWRLQENIVLIDLGEDYYTVKLALEDSQKKFLLEGSWFVTGSYVSTRVWEPNFVPIKAKINSSAFWVRLPSLPTEFYDNTILEKIRKKIEGLLKIDASTSSSLRGRFKQTIREDNNLNSAETTEFNTSKEVTLEWQTVSFTKRGKKSRRKGHFNTGTKKADKPNVNTKSYDPKSGKFLDQLQNPNSSIDSPERSRRPSNSSKNQGTSLSDQTSTLDRSNKITLGKRPTSSATKNRLPNAHDLKSHHSPLAWAKSNTNAPLCTKAQPKKAQ
ncbi:uncharacterized protein LOC124887703 [Capsicum annuum]|uniref:uncharacterized protein LOC124887703 n=1 Tax=Capsicum annuum TaxID=4072 RepID=UPI001FB14671|nr:uncharacterized protein LOC124887703 [Capsicum annuum]